MNTNQLCIILCHPEGSMNIGAVCRGMANNDIKELRIVGKRSDYIEEEISTFSIHAYPLWEKAKFYDNLKDATADCIIAAGTTRRRGKKRKDFLVYPEEFADSVADISEGRIALIFGNERTGLTDEELECCTIGINIPSSESFGSLNLSHAVQVISYIMFRSSTTRSEGYTPIKLKRLDKTVHLIGDNLKKIGFFSVTGREDMENFWRSILSRAKLSEGEAKYLEKVFVKASGLAGKKK